MRLNRRAVCIGTLAALFFTSVALAQQQPTFQSNTNVVQVDVRVFKGNQFVTGLGPDDFVVTEDGVPQKIQSVILIGGSPGQSATKPPEPAEPSKPEPPAPRARQEPSEPSVWLFVFDTPHLSPAGLKDTRDAVVQFLDSKWNQGDIGGVVFDGKMANNRLTSDRAELRTAVAGLKMAGNQRSLQITMTREWPRFQDEDEVIRVGVDNDQDTLKSVAMRACNDDPDACKRGDPAPEILAKAHQLATEIQRSTLNTLTSVVALANGLARMPGPKTVVFLSEGFVAEKLESQIRNAVGDAARAGAHFYTIDARGLNRGSASSSIIDQPQVESLVARSIHVDTLTDATNSLAVDTGGFAIRNENNFGRALDEIQRDAREYYVIGYVPTNSTFDGKYRAINVEVRLPGVKIRARRGYLALAPSMLLQPKPIPARAGTPAMTSAPAAAAVSAVPDLPFASDARILDQMSYTTAALGLRYANTNPAAAAAVRTRVESGVLSLKKFDAADVGAGYAERGWDAYERGDLDTAASELSTAAATDKRPWVSFALGYAQFARRRYPEAAEAWTRVKASVPQFESVYFDLADALSLEGKETDAIKVLRDAEQRWPKDAEIQDAIGVIEIRRTALDAAIKSFEKATTLAPADPVGYFNLGRAYQMRFNTSQRYVAAMERWMGDDEDRDKSIAAYQKYLDLHGPYEQQARDALALLQWKK